MDSVPCTPRVYQAFVERCPDLVRAWEGIAKAGEEGPLDERTAELVKLGIAIGAYREGAVQACVRKALSVGIFGKEIDQVVVLAAGVLSLPDTVAAYSWIEATLAGK